MNPSALEQRRSWYRLFPEGSIEFLLVTRIVLVIVLLALAAFQQAQRALVLVGLFGILWVDYVLVMWWLIQVTDDVRELDAPAGAEARGPRLRAGILACLPAAVLLLAVAPWTEFVFRGNPEARGLLARGVRPALAGLYVLLLPVAQRALRNRGVGPTAWTWLLLVPIVHWPALHRLLAGLRGRLGRLIQERGLTDSEGPSLAIPLADATWLLAMGPWLAVIGDALFRDGQWIRSLAPCGAVLAAVFVIADVAAMEGVQRQFLSLLRKSEPDARA